MILGLGTPITMPHGFLGGGVIDLDIDNRSLFLWDEPNGSTSFYDSLHPEYTLAPSRSLISISDAQTPPVGFNSLYFGALDISQMLRQTDNLAAPARLSLDGDISWTIEAYARRNAGTNNINAICGIWSGGQNAYRLAVSSVERPTFEYVATTQAPATTTSVNAWDHYAVARDAETGNAAIWLNGTRISTFAISGTAIPVATEPFCIGSTDNETVPWYPGGGHIGPVHVHKGTARYDPEQATITPAFPLV